MLASFITETYPNTFPRLPVREDANVFVWFSHFPDREAYEKAAALPIDPAIRSQKETSRAHQGTTRGAAAFADASIAFLTAE